jgi:polyhydroxyalkanoate synthesis regulator phasin
MQNKIGDIMLLTKKNSDSNLNRAQIREAFNDAKSLSKDRFNDALATLVNKGEINTELARKLEYVFESLLNDSVSTVMSNRGL